MRGLLFVPRGGRGSLRPLRLRGEVAVDPSTQDFFRLVIKERVRAEGRSDLSARERELLSAFLKVFASSVAYGIYGEMNRQELAKGAKVRELLHGLEPEAVEIDLPAPEEPGEYFFAPLAVLIAGAARLMLALLEHEDRRLGGTYVFCDTDSMAIVASEWGGGVTYTDERGNARRVDALSWDTVSRIRERFASLNPYDQELVAGSILKLEDVNLDEAGKETEIYALAISAKRYVLFRLDNGEPVLVKWSEHGLGHLLNPTDPDDESRNWIRQVWELLVRRALGLPATERPWFDRPAIGRLTVSSPELLRPFAARACSFAVIRETFDPLPPPPSCPTHRHGGQRATRGDGAGTAPIPAKSRHTGPHARRGRRRQRACCTIDEGEHLNVYDDPRRDPWVTEVLPRATSKRVVYENHRAIL